jgi:hypothetical protein
MMLTVCETMAFQAMAKERLTDAERDDMIDYLAANPEAGAVMQGTAGARKVRFALGGRGKSGGARVIYYFHDGANPLFLFAVYAKARTENLTKAQRNRLRQVVEAIKAQLRKSDGE